MPSLSTPFLTSWYDRGPSPGAAGTAVIFGHVDSAAVGPAVFYRLGRLRRGDLVYVTLADRHTGVFRVYAAELYAKSAFPPAIYGPTWWPTLRLVTCGGRFDPATGHYLASTVVFAESRASAAKLAGPSSGLRAQISAPRLVGRTGTAGCAAARLPPRPAPAAANRPGSVS